MTSFFARHRLISGLIQALVGARLVVVLFKPPHGGTFDLPLWLWGRQTLLLRGRGGRYAVVAAALGLLVSAGSRYVNNLLFPPPLGRNT